MTCWGKEGQDFDAAIDVVEKDFAAIRRENQAIIAQLALFIWIENLAGRNFRPGFSLVLGREGEALQDFSINRVNDNEFVCLA